jgi:hypothetical protein
MAIDRRVIMKTSVLPTATTAYAAVPGSLEEYNLTKATYNKNAISSSIGRLGGTSKMTDIDENQWGDAWSSIVGMHQEWEDFDEIWNTTAAVWGEDSGDVSISSSQTQLSTDGSDLQFCYIKNLGSTAVIISLDGGDSGTYPLKLSGGASTMFRGYSTNLKINEVYVKSSGTSTIEYLIAQ